MQVFVTKIKGNVSRTEKYRLIQSYTNVISKLIDRTKNAMGSTRYLSNPQIIILVLVVSLYPLIESIKPFP